MADNTYNFNTTPYKTYEAQIARRRKMAEALQAQADQPIEVQSYKGIQAPIPWSSVLAKALQGGISAYKANKADEDTAALDKSSNEALTQALSHINDNAQAPDVGKIELSGIPGETSVPITGRIRAPTPQDMQARFAALGNINPTGAALGAALFNQSMRQQDTEDARAYDEAHPKLISVNPESNIVNSVTGEVVTAGTPPAVKNPRSSYAQQLIDAGMVEGSPEFNAAMAKKNAFDLSRSLPTPGTPKSYLVNGKQVFLTPQRALELADEGNTVTEAPSDSDGKPKYQQGGYFVLENGQKVRVVFDPATGEQLMETPTGLVPLPQGARPVSSGSGNPLTAEQHLKLGTELTADVQTAERLKAYLNSAETGPQGFALLGQQFANNFITLFGGKLTQEGLNLAVQNGQLQSLIGNLRLETIGGGVMTEQDAIRVINALGGDVDALRKPQVVQAAIEKILKAKEATIDNRISAYNRDAALYGVDPIQYKLTPAKDDAGGGSGLARKPGESIPDYLKRTNQ